MDKQSLANLKLWPDNYNEGDVGMIAASIRRFGFNDPPGVWKDNEVRDGNHRVMALRIIKAAGPRPNEDKKWPPQGVTVKGADWFIDWIDLGHLNAQEATAYAIAANRSVELASQDDLRLSMLLQNIAVEDEKLLAATGYSGDDLDELLRFMDKPAEDAGAQVDRAAELQEQWQVQRGDLWLIGEHKLLCGDSTVREDVERLMDGERADAVVTDPPYLLDIAQGNKGCFAQNYAKLTGDALNEIATSVDYRATLEAIGIVGNLFIFCSNAQIPDWMGAFVDVGYKPTLLVWNKYNSVPFSHNTWRQDIEFVLHGRGPNSIFEGDAELKRKVTTLQINPSKHGHPTEKPVELIDKYLRISTHKDSLVLDPFGGSGTTMVAAEQLGRVCRMIEISEKYCAVILERMSNLGLKPERVAK